MAPRCARRWAEHLIEQGLAERHGSRVVEVPITFVERREGASKLSWRVIAESIVLPWRLAVRRDTLPVP